MTLAPRAPTPPPDSISPQSVRPGSGIPRGGGRSPSAKGSCKAAQRGWGDGVCIPGHSTASPPPHPRSTCSEHPHQEMWAPPRQQLSRGPQATQPMFLPGAGPSQAMHPAGFLLFGGLWRAALPLTAQPLVTRLWKGL